MKQNFPILILGCFFLLASGSSVVAQGESSAHHTVTSELQGHNIKLDPDSLLDALNNPDPEVRGLAAAELVSKRQSAAIPAIVSALKAEKDPRARLKIAQALAWAQKWSLNSSSAEASIGTDTLNDICGAADQSWMLRVRAARYLLQVGDESCLSSALQMLQTGPPESRASLLSMLSSFEHPSKQQLVEMRQINRSFLVDSESTTRMAAASTAAKLNDLDAIPALSNALAIEQVDLVRKAIESSLRILKEHYK